MAKAAQVDTNASRNVAGTAPPAAGVGGRLRSGRTLSAGIDGADDGDSGAGGGSEEYSRRVAEAVTRSAGSGGNGWGGGGLPRRGGTGDCFFGLWDGERSASGQDCWAG